MERTKSGLLNKNKTSAIWLYVIILALVAGKLLLSGTQMIHVYTLEQAPIDDGSMFSAANSILRGEWLGEYSWVAISKNMFFAVWLAFLNVIKMPLLIGNQLLYLLACAVTVFALKPIIKNQWARLLFFAVLWLSPFSWAQFALRLYRDSIFPYLVLLFFAGIMGFCLRKTCR